MAVKRLLRVGGRWVLAATVLGVFLVPVLYVVVQRLTDRDEPAPAPGKADAEA